VRELFLTLMLRVEQVKTHLRNYGFRYDTIVIKL